MALLARIGKFLLDAVFPPRCPLCGEMILPEQKTCEQCTGQLVSILPPVCNRCGRPERYCRCGDSVFRFARCVSPFAYKGVIRKGIHRLKFDNGTSSARYFAEAMADTIRREYGSEAIDFVVCVPMHPIDKNERGYNQAALLARRTARLLGLPFYEDVLVKRVLNTRQHTLAHNERSGNVMNIFEVKRTSLAKGSTILLCDDVITTGSTLDQCSAALLAAGAARVLCVTAASVLGSENQAE
ncbi:MAG: ComF family protein [Ruminococcaceae bacterium]|nr:ComF family protein [Oscillospiraceae bacterium]